MSSTTTSTTPNAILGYLPDGKPVYEIRGGAPEEGETPPESGTEGTETGTTEGQEPEAGDDEDKDLDDKVKAKLSKLRGEAAGWRTQVRELQAKLDAAVKPEDVDKIRTELSEEIAKRDRALVIERHKLPKELAALLPTSGKTTEELDEIAKGLTKFAAPAADDDEDLAGGLSGKQNKGGASSPTERARQIRARQANNRVF